MTKIKQLPSLAGAILVAAYVAPLAPAASAMPLDASVAASGAPADVETVQWRRRGGRGAGVGAALLGGAIIGGMLAAPRYGYGYGYDPYYPAPVYVGPPVGGGVVAYCMRRFKSYDPASGTYLGYDGYRHPCP